MLRARFFQALAIGFLVLYAGVAFMGWFALDDLSPYATYGFDVIFVGVIFALYPNWEWKKSSFTLAAGVAFFFALFAGFATYESAGLLNYPIPFSLRDPETVWFLLVAGPVLEELIFRGALWKLFEVVTGSALPAYLFTAVLFSYSEFHLIHQVKPEYADFVRYQASFCLGLGLFCGGMRMKYGWRAALITHAIFNFGFWLGSF